MKRSDQLRALANVIDMAAHPGSVMGDKKQQRADVRIVENLMRQLGRETSDYIDEPVVLLTMFVERYSRGDAVDTDCIRHTHLGPGPLSAEWEKRLLQPVERRDSETDLIYGTHAALEPFVAIDFYGTSLDVFDEDREVAKYLASEWDEVVADALATSSQKAYTCTVAVRIRTDEDDVDVTWIGPVDTVTVKGQTFPINNFFQ